MNHIWQPSESFETPGERILEMIVRQCEPREVLETLCLQIGGTEQQRQVAFFTLEGESWTLAAKGELNSRSEETLAGLVPESLSRLLLRQDISERGGFTFEHGWARHLYSGIGEMLGFIVCLGAGPFEPTGRYAATIDAVCRLATLVIEQRNLRDELTWQGDHDSVTGLYTQTFFERLLGFHMQHQNAPAAALLHINLDRFRLVNDVLGHALGNRILKLVGRRFNSCLRPDDVLARSGGDEFTVLLKGGTPCQASRVADRLLRSLAEPLSVDEHQVFISASIGISCSGISCSGIGGAGVGIALPAPAPQTLQREAYVALYHAKQDGKARWMHFNPSMAATPPERLEMEKRLRSALARREMLLYYQPQIDLASGFVTGAEALLRWNPGGLGIISPGTFVPILEETGMIVEFGRWVLREACHQGKRWAETTGLRLRLGVNVSALQLRHPEFVTDVKNALLDSGFPAELLELELTETIFIRNYQPARHILQQLRDLGVALALDDFGTGQSSLSYLQELPFQRLKIDQSFVRSISGVDRCPPVIENVVSMARGLGMTSIAEGIEHAHQAEVLRAIGCDEGQGYFFSYPLAAEEFLGACAVLPRSLPYPSSERMMAYLDNIGNPA